MYVSVVTFMIPELLTTHHSPQNSKGDCKFTFPKYKHTCLLLWSFMLDLRGMCEADETSSFFSLTKQINPSTLCSVVFADLF